MMKNPSKLLISLLSFSTTTKYTLCNIIGASSLLVTAETAKTSPSYVISKGLYNLANTCYLNAQLQCAFHIPRVRQIVLDDKVEDGSDDKCSSPSMAQQALQRVFSDMLQKKASPSSSVSILCRVMGINPYEQQDSQEFWKLFLPTLQNEKLVNLYQGYYEDYIIAQDGSGREKRREEIFLDLSLEVSNCNSVTQSITNNFCKPELLSKAEGNGWRPDKDSDEKVDALKGIRLNLRKKESLPSILQLHLKRFQYDWNTDQMSKINSSFEFPKRLNLSQVCNNDDSSEEERSNIISSSESTLYDLQSVVIHKGYFGSGHYYTYVRPSMNSDNIDEDDWYRIDDHQVTKVHYEDVICDAYGGNQVSHRRQKQQHETSLSAMQGEQHQQRNRFFLRRLLFFGGGRRRKVSPSTSTRMSKEEKMFGYGGTTSSAYMLQYVKRSEVRNLYCCNDS